MEQTIAERHLCKEQEVEHWQTCNNGSMSSDTHLREDPSESWYARSRAGWSSSRADNPTQDKPVCRDFRRGKCVRGTSCKYRHCESDSQDGCKFYVCPGFLGGRCNRVSCRFLHLEPDRSNVYGSNGKENLDAIADSGNSLFYGGRMDYDSRNRSFSREPRSRSPCRKFLNGTCHRGESCPYLHSEYPTHDIPRNDCSTQLQQGVPTTSRNAGFGEGNIGSAPQISQEVEEGNEGSDRSPRFSRMLRSKSPCHNFLRGRCYRGASCPYYHTDTYLGARNDGSPWWRRGLEATLENPGFHEGSVEITSRTSEHHEEANGGDDRGNGPFFAGRRSRSPCRHFIRGRCYRGAYCPYLHPDTHARPGDECSMQQHQGVAATSENPYFSKGSVDMTSGTFEEHEEANECNDRSTRSFPPGRRRKSPCRNFLRGRCYRGEYCPYLHLDIYVGPRDDGSTQQYQGLAATSENPGSGEESEGIALRTSEKHEEANEDEDLRSRYFPRGARSRSPCRRFLSGRCYRGASCPYLHPGTCERSRYPVDDIAGCEQNRARSVQESMQLASSRDNMDISSRSWSFERHRRRPFGDLGSDKPKPEVCLKYCRGRCTLGESCKYLHSFHEYAKSASDWTKKHVQSDAAPTNSSGTHQCEPSMTCQQIDGSFDEKTKGEYAGNTEKPNITDEKDDAVVVHQQKCPIDGEVIERNCDFSEADEDINSRCRSLKRRRSRSRSPVTLRDEFDDRKMRGDESQINFHRRRCRSRSPLTPRDDFGYRKMTRDEIRDDFPRGRGYNVAPFRYPYSHSYRYNGPRYYVNKEPYSKFAATSVDPSSYKVNEDPDVMETQGCDGVTIHEMQLDQGPNNNQDFSTAIVNKKSDVESVKNAVQPSHVDQDGGGLLRDCCECEISKGENAIDSLLVESDSTTHGENRISPMDTIVCASNKDDNAEANADLSQEGSDETDERRQALKTYIRKLERKSSDNCCVEPWKGDVTDPSTHELPSSSAGKASLGQPDIVSVTRVSDETQDLVMIGHPVQGPEQGNGVMSKEGQNNVESAQATKQDGTSVVGHSESNSMQTSETLLKAAISSSRRKLLVLDVNGLLADIVAVGEVPRGYKPDMIVAMKAVFKRPFCDDFLEFCFDRFDVGVWSSRTKKNVDRVVDLLLSNTKKRLLFCWDQAHCTETGYKTIENRDKPLVLKELKKLWEKQETDLPWDKGFYNETNTVLLDDSPYKALRNPPYTAIFPYAYKFRDAKDRSLGPGGDLRIYLERLAAADNVQKFIQENPFGQRPITKSNLSWGFYSKIAVAHANRQEGNSRRTHATKVVGDDASKQERNANNSAPSKSIGAYADQQKGNADNANATKSAGDHAEQEGNVDKTPSAMAVGAHSNQREGYADNNSATGSVAPNANQQEGSADKTPATKDFVAHVDQQDRVADNTDMKNVASHANQQGGNADNTTDAQVVAHSDQQEGDGDITDATISVGACANQPKEKC